MAARQELLTVENLESEWTRQADRLIELGFHTKLGMKEEAYRASLPKFLPQPPEYKGRFDVPLLVDPRVSLRKQHKRAGIWEYKPRVRSKIRNVTEVPDKPYTIWTNQGILSSPLNEYTIVTEKRYVPTSDEVGCPQIEVTALYIQHPGLFNIKHHNPDYVERRGIMAAGSIWRYGLAGLCTFNNGKPELWPGRINYPNQRWHMLTRGEIINIGV